MGGLLQGIFSFLSGAPQAANTAGGYYQNAANEIVNSTGSGSPAASTFVAEQNAGLQPYFNQQDQSLIARENALGIPHSGAAGYDLQTLMSGQSGALAQAAAPLYQQALAQYGNILGAMPGAQNTAYQDAIQQFLQAASIAAGGAGGMGGGGGGSFPDASTLDPYGQAIGYNLGNYAGVTTTGSGGYTGGDQTINPYGT